MSLRSKLLLLSLLTLVLPWAGCQYAREMESALRVSEQQSLTAVAQTIAASLRGRGDLLYRAVATGDLAPTEFDLEPIALPGAPALDGYLDDWPAAKSWRHFKKPPDELQVLAGMHEHMLYLLLDVRDDHPVFDARNAEPRESERFGDRVWLGFEDPNGAERQVLIAATNAGPVQARYLESREYGEEVSVVEPRIGGAWLPTAKGYRVELRVPLAMLGARLGVLIDDRDRRGVEAQSYGSLDPENLHTRGRLIAAAPELQGYLTQFVQPGMRLAVATPAGNILSEVNTPSAPRVLTRGRGVLESLYRLYLDRSNEPRTIEATAPIYAGPKREMFGQLRVTQSTDGGFALRDRALTTLVNFTLITSLIAVVATFAFAAYLALRLGRLRRASESALTRTGIITTFPETQSPDELGDVARSFSTLLQRLDEYTSYLRTLAGKLAHEIRTPLTIVRSSLENLETEVPSSETARSYLDRAKEGGERLAAILHAMSAASRVEEAIHNAERARFDLVPLINSVVAGYRIAFPQREFTVETPPQPVVIDGAGDLVAQLLDKLVDNAVDFSPPHSLIVVRLVLEPGNARVEVENAGSQLAPEIQQKIFESLWQSREDDRDDRPHFGLGLYIVRLIAQFHDGHASAENLPDGAGVRFAVRLPLERGR